MKQTIDAIIASMTEYIINYAGTHGAWADWDDSETVRAEFSDCDAIKSIEEEDLDFYEVYRDALDAAYNKFNYKITLGNYGKFGDMMSCDVWYATNKAELVEKVYDDCGGFEYAEEQYTKKELYEMVEEIGGEAIMNVIKNIESLGYKISKREPDAHNPYQLALTLPNGETKALDSCLGRKIIIGGKVETTRRELIQAVYGLSEEEMIAYEYGCDKRTHDYLNSVKNYIGLIGVSSGTEYFGEKIIENETTKGYEVNFANASGRISKVDNNFVVQILMSIGDDIGVDTFTFNKYPSAHDFETAWALNKCQIKFRDHEYPVTYECWECGKELHWLDARGSFHEKIEHLEDRYCGC